MSVRSQLLIKETLFKTILTSLICYLVNSSVIHDMAVRSYNLRRFPKFDIFQESKLHRRIGILWLTFNRLGFEVHASDRLMKNNKNVWRSYIFVELKILKFFVCCWCWSIERVRKKREKKHETDFEPNSEIKSSEEILPLRLFV